VARQGFQTRWESFGSLTLRSATRIGCWIMVFFPCKMTHKVAVALAHSCNWDYSPCCHCLR
jgi:hypothetical protein